MRARAAAAEAPQSTPGPAPSAGAEVSARSNDDAHVAGSAAGAAPRKPGLSKKVEYPGDEGEISELLSEGDVDPAGRDLFGLTALHKFAACKPGRASARTLSANTRRIPQHAPPQPNLDP